MDLLCRWMRSASSHFPYSSLREHQSGILSRRDFKGTLAPHHSCWVCVVFPRRSRFIFCQKNAVGAQGVCLVINRANQSITALIMASVDRPHMSPAPLYDKCALSTWGIRPNIPPDRPRTRSATIYFPRCVCVCCSSPPPPLLLLMIKSETGARVNKGDWNRIHGSHTRHLVRERGACVPCVMRFGPRRRSS